MGTVGTRDATNARARAVKRFPASVVAAASRSRILGIRAGAGRHRFIGLWVVVVEGRLFVRSWSRTPGGWHRTFLDDPAGAMTLDGRTYRIRAVQTRSERLKHAVDEAYRDKYNTPASLKYVRDLSRAPSRATTTELVPS